MGLKEFTESHVVTVGVALLVAGAALGATPAAIVWQASDSAVQAKQESIDRLNNQLGSVTRTVGDSSSATLPVDEIIVTPNQAQDLSLTRLVHHEDDDFYAPELDPDGWKYSVTDEASLIRLQTDLSQEADELLGEVPAFRIHLWQGPEVTEVSMGTQYLNAFPLIFLQRLNPDKLAEAIDRLAGNNNLRKFVYDDPLGAMFQLNVVRSVATSTEKVSSLISDIQRTENAVYCEITLAFHDVKINGVQTDRFYVRRELIILKAGRDVVLISTSVPSTDRRSSASPLITEFLNGIRVVTS